MIRVDKLTKTFEKRSIFSQTSITFEPGKIYALVGKSGSGKTTLLNILAKLEPYQSGEITYFGKSLKRLKSTTFYKNELGYLFQNFGLLDSQTVKDNLALGVVNQRMTKQQKERAYQEVLQQVGLAHIDVNQRVYELSGGEAQRVAIAKMILKQPQLILADEPTASLDPNTAQDIMTILKGLKTQERIIIIATHTPMIWEKADVIIDIADISHV